MEVEFFESEATRASGTSSALFHEIDALVLLTHPCLLRIVGYCLASRRFAVQMRTEFALCGWLHDALGTLNDTGKVIAIADIVIGRQFIHSRE
jgi:hypothetical protein